jgi:hypothetical protein
MMSLSSITKGTLLLVLESAEVPKRASDMGIYPMISISISETPYDCQTARCPERSGFNV